MKTPPSPSIWTKSILLLLTFFITGYLPAQIQWYQNQDGQNTIPEGTFAGSIKPFTLNTFVACYKWQTTGDQYSWKVSKSTLGGTELKTFYATGTTAEVEMKTNRNGTVYVLKKDYPLGQSPVYTLYRLNSNLEVTGQRILNFPGDYSITSLNAFETDNDANIFLAGDGQYPDGPGFSPASFITKLDKNLHTKWTRMQQGATSFAHLNVESSGKVWLVEDSYNFFPDVYIRKYSSSGTLYFKDTVSTSYARYDMYTKTDGDGNLFLYGNTGVGDTSQGMYLYKLARNTGSIVYNRTLQAATGFQLYDLMIDNNDRIYTSAWRYLSNGSQENNICRINNGNGNINWSKRIDFTQDSLLLYKLVDAGDKIYVLGERRCGAFLSKGQGVSIRKTGQLESTLGGPDSTYCNKSHTLTDGIVAYNGNLVTIGNTTEIDMQTFNSNYYKAFAVSLNNNQCFDRPAVSAKGAGADELTTVSATASIYPNPVSEYFIVTGLNEGGYDRITLYNMMGEQVYSKSTSGNTTRVEAGTLKAGTYLATLYSSSTLKQKTIKIIVSR